MTKREMSLKTGSKSSNGFQRNWLRKWSLRFVLSLIVLALLNGCASQEQSLGMKNENSMSKESSSSANQSAASDRAERPATEEKQQETKAVAESQNAAKGESNPTGTYASDPSKSSSMTIFESMTRKIIYHANLLIRTQDYMKARQEIENIIFTSNAYIIQMNEKQSDNHNEVQMTVKVPQNGFAGFIQEMEKVSPGKVTKSMEGMDVTEEYVDLESRLKAKQVVEARLLEFMKGAQKTDDLLRISKDLSIVQEEIERIQGRIRYLDNNVAFSTVDIRLVEEVKNVTKKEPAAGTLSKAGTALLDSMKGIYSFLSGLFIVLAALLPLIFFFGLLSIPLWIFYRNRREKLQLLREQLARENQNRTDINP
jgi:hypothetical protein